MIGKVIQKNELSAFFITVLAFYERGGAVWYKKEEGAGSCLAPESVCLYMCVDVLFINHDNQIFGLFPKCGRVCDV